MKKGDKVIITYNPHERDADKIIGIVKGYRVGVGFGGCDLADVEYISPNSGKSEIMPFGLCNIQATTAESLIKLAEHYEEQAAQFRKLAAETNSGKTV